MAKWYAEIERTDVLVVVFDFPDGETPTKTTVLCAAVSTTTSVSATWKPVT